MKTVTLTDACAAALIPILTREWTNAATMAAVPQTERVWQNPCGSSPAAVRIKWQRTRATKAATLSKVLFAFGITTPEIDTSRYLKPIGEWYVKNAGAKKTDKFFDYKLRIAYVRELEIQICGETQ